MSMHVDGNNRLNSSDQLNNAIQPLLTDFYQISMAYAYWKNGRASVHAVFDLFFRKNPFNSEFTLFAGLGECLKYMREFKFVQSDIDYLKIVLPSYVESEFYDYLLNLTLDDVKLYAIPEGTLVFPRVPLITVEGPMLKVQLLETTLLVLINYASLVTTNAARFRLAAGSDKVLLEFGLRRAQGPDGGLSASKYCYIGGFDATSNILAGKLFNIPIKGTNAHAFICSYTSLNELSTRRIKDKNNVEVDLVNLSVACLNQVKMLLNRTYECNEGELASFIAYAIAYPDNFLVLIDTYDTLKSGIINFCAVALALNQVGYKATGVRLDSGDLAYLSRTCRNLFTLIARELSIEWFSTLKIVASNDIEEDVIYSLKAQSHEIDVFGVGTHLVTCKKQPALGCVYKLVEIDGKPCIKISEDIQKITFPGRKKVYRFYDSTGFLMCDLLAKYDEPTPNENEKILCKHPFFESKRAFFRPSKIEIAQKLYWSDGKIQDNYANLSVQDIRERVKAQLGILREDHKRQLNPTPYKVSVTQSLYTFIRDIWEKNAPIGQID